ncbi:hypothetical protein [Marinobacterium stanieri]|uniref:hypothetical protein n=1 Tax=Marinobacterium stanieri TaxID=49186 RepID=UPI003A928C73
MEDGITIKRRPTTAGLSTIEILDGKDRPQAGKDIRPMVKLVDEQGNDVFPRALMPAQYLLPAKAIVPERRC